jgi:hypothetical protein
MKQQTKEEIVFITFEQAQDLVERIADRVSNFDYTMGESEKDSMAQLLSEIGVKVSDLIDVSCLADNYAINAEIVTPSDILKLNSRQKLVDYYMDNPSLTCDEDYLPNEDRLRYYTTLVYNMTSDEVLTELQMAFD